MTIPLSRRAAAVFFPERCLCCHEPVPAGAGCCEKCAASLPRIEGDVCPFCGRGKGRCSCGHRRRHFDGCVSCFYYEAGMERGILAFKKEGSAVTASYLAAEMAAAVRLRTAGLRFALIAYVPMTARDRRARGFNQARLIAKALSGELLLPMGDILVKIQETAPQKKLTAIQRSGNMLGVFDLAEGAVVKNKRILLVDDIITTGATLDECAKMLKIYGAESVVAATVAATVLEERDMG